MVSLKHSINSKEVKNKKRNKVYQANSKTETQQYNHIKYRWSKHPHGLKMKNYKASRNPL